LSSFLISTGLLYFLPTLPNILSFIFLGLNGILFCLFRQNLFIKIFFVILTVFVFANLRVNFDQHSINSQYIDFYNDTKNTIVLIGYICAEPDLRIKKGKYTICTQEILFAQTKTKIQGKVLISTQRYPEYTYGDVFEITGQLKTPAEFEDFSYLNYLSRYGIFSVMYQPKIKILNQKQGNLFYRKLFNWKKKLESRINQIYPEPNSSFLAGLLVGSRRGIPENVTENFNLTGLTHIIAISGYNITIIIVFVSGLLKFLPRKLRFYCATINVILFTIFVGASAAVVRAAIMGILGLFALNQGRQSNITIFLLLTATLMVLHNPKILWFDVGFQLSFLAILGIIYIVPFFEKWFEKIPQTLGIREALMLTLSAQITAVPLILFNFERLSLIAPMANILVAPFIPLAMLFGFISILVSFLSFQLSLIIGFFAYIFLEIILISADFLAKISWASLEIENVSIFVVIGYYLILIYLIYRTIP